MVHVMGWTMSPPNSYIEVLSPSTSEHRQAWALGVFFLVPLAWAAARGLGDGAVAQGRRDWGRFPGWLWGQHVKRKLVLMSLNIS